MSSPIISIVKQKDVLEITSALNDNGYEDRYELYTKYNLLHIDDEQFVQYYSEFGYKTDHLRWLVDEVNDGNVAVIVRYDYEDLPGIYEIMNSYGYTILDALEVDSPVYHAYHLQTNEREANCEYEEDIIPISIPAHLVQDPQLDQLE